MDEDNTKLFSGAKSDSDKYGSQSTNFSNGINFDDDYEVRRSNFLSTTSEEILSERLFPKLENLSFGLLYPTI